MKPRKHLSIGPLILMVRNSFSKIAGQVKGNRKEPVKLVDCLMSAVAMFSLKYPSLLQFDKDVTEKVVKNNIKTLYKVVNVPSDTYMRERLDEVEPEDLRPAFKQFFAALQRGNELEQFQFIDGYYLLSMDATEYFSSNRIYCGNCCVKIHRNGDKTYYKQILGGAIVHPNLKQVIPFAPEPIRKSDGSAKNDCEMNAARRFLIDLRREHPHLKAIIGGDGLFSKAPIVLLLKSLGFSYIISAKPGDHKYLFDFVRPVLKKYSYTSAEGIIQEYYYANSVPINEANSGVEVSFLEYIETTSEGKVQKFSWITDIILSEKNVHQIMQGGRARWRIENETFNTLKNQNYHFEHNFGHGKKNLSTVFAMLTMLAFGLDQAQEISDQAFKQALEHQVRKKYLWEKLRGLITFCFVDSWTTVWRYLGTDDFIAPSYNSS